MHAGNDGGFFPRFEFPLMTQLSGARKRRFTLASKLVCELKSGDGENNENIANTRTPLGVLEANKLTAIRAGGVAEISTQQSPRLQEVVLCSQG
jgi:hypothetical protein